MNNVLLASPLPQQDSLEDFPVAPLQKTAATTVRGPKKRPQKGQNFASWPPSQSAQDSTAAPDLAQEARVFGLIFGNSRDPVISFFNGFKAF